jgi:hypothetical protein
MGSRPLNGQPTTAGLQNLAALQNSTGINLGGSTGTAATDISQTNLQGLATLANLSVANPTTNPMSMQNLVTLAAMTGVMGPIFRFLPPGVNPIAVDKYININIFTHCHPVNRPYVVYCWHFCVVYK